MDVLFAVGKHTFARLELTGVDGAALPGLPGSVTVALPGHRAVSQSEATS